ncbi:endonuclease domain-containing protein [Gordonia sp. NPDC003429]
MTHADSDVPPLVGHAIRPGRVFRLADVHGSAIDELADAVASELPVILDYRGPDERTARQVTAEILDALESTLITLFPAWLPHRSSGDRVDVDEAEALARQLCAHVGLATAVVVPLARTGASHNSTTPHAVPEQRAATLVALLRHFYGRGEVVLAVRASSTLSESAQQAAAAACAWLAEHGRITVWLTADALPVVHRIPVLRLGVAVPPHPIPTDPLPTDPLPINTERPILIVSRPTGAPAPHSAAEQALEHALAQHEWARGRVWNRCPSDLAALSGVAVVDVLWPDERVVVEVDGPDHRRADKYARDRSRDNMLQRHGYLVLRYPNETVLDDPLSVVAELRDVLTHRNPNTGSLHRTLMKESPWTTRS